MDAITLLREDHRNVRDLFRQFEKAGDRAFKTKRRLADLGELMDRAKLAAPKRPHPRSPDEPPGNIVAGPIAAVLDAGKDAVSRVTRRSKRAS
ncbi:MAG TPA: hypothetical protein VGB19_03890 [Actinomycetota bacterium]